MDKRIIIPVFVLIVCFTGNYCFSQQVKKEAKPDQFRAVQWTQQNGLSNDHGNTMIKDATGFIWTGSKRSEENELCRFDGSVFKKYYPDTQKSGFINSGMIYSFREDSLNNLWIGTEKGLSRYDIKADTFTNFTTAIDSEYSRRPVIPFWATRSHVYCLESGSGFVTYDIHSLERKRLLPAPDKIIDKVPGINYIILDSASNCLWMLEGYSHNPERGGIQRISLDNGKRESYTWPCFRNNVTHRHSAEAMQFDRKRNSIWINSGDGLLEFTLADRQFRKIEAINELTKLKGYERGVGIDIDKDRRIWFSTFYHGIFIYDPETDDLERVFSDPYQQTEAGKDNLHIYCDRDGIAWTSNWADHGIYELIPHTKIVNRYAANPKKKDSLSSGLITTIVQGPRGKLWIGTADGINIFDPVTETFEVLREKDLPGIKGTAIIPLHIDTVRQIAWLNAGSQETFEQYFGMQMYEMDLRTRKSRPIVFRDGSRQIDSFNVPHTLVRPYKNGIIFCDELHGVFEVKEGSLVATLSISLKKGFGAIALTEDSSLFLQHGGGLPNSTYKNKNGKWIKTSTILDSLNYFSILYDKMDQTFWVSLQKKLVNYDKEFREIAAYRQEDGYDAPFINMEFDDDGNIWFIKNGSKAFGRFNPVTGIFTIFSETDGFYKRDYIWYPPITKDVSGNLYTGIGWKIGASEPDWGFDRIYPERYSAVNTMRVYLKSLSVNQKPLPFSTEINNLEKLSLRYNQKLIRIETGILNFFTKGNGSIRYKLERDREGGEWLYPPDHTIRLEDLSPGTYRLVIQAANASKEFIGPERLLAINISPPFWLTWWFRSLAIVFVLALIYGLIQYRSRHLKERNILLEKKVMERTNELNNSLAELKTTQDQLIQSEKMASLGELTSGIAHEIKNPLNFVNNFSEINMELITEIEEEQLPNLDENQKAQMAHIIKTLKRNSEKINHHGKRVDGIVKGMLQHSRLGNVKKELVDINALCDESLKLAWHGFRANEKTFNATFETRFDPDLPNVMVIPQDFGRVMINLINNAFYAVHEKKKRNQSESSPDTLQAESLYKPSVIVSTKKNGNKIFITVSDNGMGIPPLIMNKIFQPFFTTKPTGEGTGLGLSMSYDIISKSHGGEIKAKSKEGLGTDFEIILPVS